MSSNEPKLRVVPKDQQRLIVVKRELTETSQQTQDNLWRVMLEGAQEHGRGEMSGVYFQRRRLAISPIWIPVTLGLALVVLAILQQVL